MAGCSEGIWAAQDVVYAQCLVIIALNEGMMPSELAKEAGIPAPTVSRIVHALAKNRQKGEAYGLVEIVSSVSSKESLREKKLYLTPKGKKMFDTAKSGADSMSAENRSALTFRSNLVDSDSTSTNTNSNSSTTDSSNSTNNSSAVRTNSINSSSTNSTTNNSSTVESTNNSTAGHSI